MFQVVLIHSFYRQDLLEQFFLCFHGIFRSLLTYFLKYYDEKKLTQDLNKIIHTRNINILCYFNFEIQ